MTPAYVVDWMQHSHNVAGLDKIHLQKNQMKIDLWVVWPAYSAQWRP